MAKSGTSLKSFLLCFLLALSIACLDLEVYAVPKVIRENYVALDNLQDTGLTLYLGKEDLTHDLSEGDFDISIFFDGSSLIKEKSYPQNIKLEVYTMDKGEKSLVNLINRTVKNKKSVENILFIVALPRIEENTTLYFDVYDTQNVLHSTFLTTVEVEANNITS